MRTSVDHVVVVQVVDGAEDLLDGLRGILLRELALVTDAVEEFSSRGQLRHDVELVLRKELVPALRRMHEETATAYPRLEPVDELDNVRVLQPLQHFELVVQPFSRCP